jgi:hypothetical protein
MAEDIIIPKEAMIDAKTIASAILPSLTTFFLIEKVVISSIIAIDTINTTNPTIA